MSHWHPANCCLNQDLMSIEFPIVPPEPINKKNVFGLELLFSSPFPSVMPSASSLAEMLIYFLSLECIHFFFF
jgi:hypothetical protein